MFTEVTEKIFINPRGEKIEQTTPAIALELAGERKLVPVKELENIHLDTEYLDDASMFYFSYKGLDYETPVPSRDSVDWEILQEIVDPE